jgi:hypothetical protein
MIRRELDWSRMYRWYQKNILPDILLLANEFMYEAKKAHSIDQRTRRKIICNLKRMQYFIFRNSYKISLCVLTFFMLAQDIRFIFLLIGVIVFFQYFQNSQDKNK